MSPEQVALVKFGQPFVLRGRENALRNPDSRSSNGVSHDSRLRDRIDLVDLRCYRLMQDVLKTRSRCECGTLS